jgi:hypothetical protein
MTIEIIKLDPNSVEGKKLSQDMENEIKNIKASIAAAGYTSCEGVYFDEDGEPKSINPETD